MSSGHLDCRYLAHARTDCSYREKAWLREASYGLGVASQVICVFEPAARGARSSLRARAEYTQVRCCLSSQERRRPIGVSNSGQPQNELDGSVFSMYTES